MLVKSTNVSGEEYVEVSLFSNCFKGSGNSCAAYKTLICGPRFV